MHPEWKRDHLLVSTDPAKLDVDAVHAFLQRAYWSVGIPHETVERALQHSLCLGLYDGGAQVGLARVITDHATFGYLCDVYVLESHRGQGLGKWLIECVMAHPSVTGLRRFNLGTRDAHALYSRHGFKPLLHPGNHMELHKPDMYRTAADAGIAATWTKSGEQAANALAVLFPYRYEGMWVFDDPSVGLAREPFVFGIDEMLTRLTESISDAGSGFRLIYATAPFPGYQAKLEWRREEYGGNWYFCPQFGIEGWLCPALFKYFDKAPQELYAKAEPKVA